MPRRQTGTRRRGSVPPVLLGVGVPVCGAWATPARQVEAARRAEDLGYASLWTFQRLLYPADAGQAGGAPGDRRWAPVYRSVADPLITLAYLAGHTTRARLGVAVVNMPWFSPILLAKQAAALDRVSAGRLDLGLGLGWAEEEYAAAGAPTTQRGRRAEEFVRCLDVLLAADGPVSFAGEFYRVPAAHVEPPPAQRPRPPLLLGGSADAALRRAGRLADGWVSGSGHDLAAIGRAADTVRAAAAEAGKDAAGVRIVCRGAVRVRPGGRADRRLLTGALEEIAGDLDRLAAAGVTETFLDLNFDREIGSVDADPGAAMERLHAVLEFCAPRAA